MIRQFVENGGTYIGFCAGAYFACNRVEFEIGTPLGQALFHIDLKQDIFILLLRCFILHDDCPVTF